MENVKTCPFCGSAAKLEPWHGGSPTKMMVSCSNEQCPVAPATTGETRAEAIDQWNTRTEGSNSPICVETDGED